MESMREIGQTLTAEQNLTGEDITWLIAMAHAVLRAFVWADGQPMRTLATTLGILPQTLHDFAAGGAGHAVDSAGTRVGRGTDESRSGLAVPVGSGGTGIRLMALTFPPAPQAESAQTDF